MRGPEISGAVNFQPRTIAVASGAVAVVASGALVIALVFRLALAMTGEEPDTGGADSGTAHVTILPQQADDTSILLRSTPFRPRRNADSTRSETPTSLALTLRGIREQAGGSGAAIISDATGKQRLYTNGDQVSQTARIVEIRKDSVVLSHAGRLETLHLARRHSSGSSQTDQRFTTHVVTLDRDAALAALTQLGLGRAQRQDGRVAVYPPLNEAVFARLDIRRGDIITAIGGVRIDDQTDLAGLVGQTTSDRLQIDLERRGRARRLLLRMTDDSGR